VPDLQHTLTALAVLRTEVQTPLPEIVENQAPLPASSTPSAPGAALTIDIPSPPALDASGEVFTYQVYPGDTLQAVAKRFAVEPGQISSAGPLPTQGLLPPGQVLFIPNQVGESRYQEILLPDSEVINSPSAQDFQIEAFIRATGGYLSQYQEQVNGTRLSGAEILEKVSLENSINPRLLLAILEFRSGWVYGDLVDAEQLNYPIGFYVPDYKGLYYELVLTATHLGVGYYGWRSGDSTALAFQDGSYIRLSPGVNAGTAALQVVFSKISSPDEWRTALYAEGGFMDLYAVMFGDPWYMAAQTGVLYPADITQPALSLPFSAGERWGFTGGPHRSWNAGSPRGALDFSPVTGEPACTTSRAWVTASAPGVITRTSDSVLVLDLDGDGYEQTGWVLVYLHIVPADDLQPGNPIAADQRLGHPSCERGNSTGTHVHLARKYNGEWLPAGDPFAFSLSGWLVVPGEKSYQGELQKGGRSITANPGGPSSSLIIRED
jgi:LysM repeat protein